MRDLRNRANSRLQTAADTYKRAVGFNRAAVLLWLNTKNHDAPTLAELKLPDQALSTGWSDSTGPFHDQMIHHQPNGCHGKAKYQSFANIG